MRLFEDEITDTIATDGPCEVLCVEERIEVQVDTLTGDPRRRRSHGVVVFRAKSRMYPRQKADGWEVPASARETRIIITRSSLSGTELPRDAGRYLGTFRQDGVRFYAFLARDPESAARPGAPEGQRGASGPAPAAEGGRNRAPSGQAPPGAQRPAPAPASRQQNDPPGRQ